MSDPGMPNQRQFGSDTYARQIAWQAKQASEAATPVVRSVDVPALSLGGSATLTVALPDMGNAVFAVVPTLLASATLLGGLSVGGIVARTRTSVSVLVRAPLVAVAAGAVLQVVCFRAT